MIEHLTAKDRGSIVEIGGVVILRYKRVMAGCIIVDNDEEQAPFQMVNRCRGRGRMSWEKYMLFPDMFLGVNFVNSKHYF